MANIYMYADPATTALLWQILAGVVITLGAVLGIWWRTISTFFKTRFAKIFGKKKSEEETNSESQELLDEVGELNDENTQSEQGVDAAEFEPNSLDGNE